MNTTFLLTGGNLANRAQNLQQAFRLIEERSGTVVKASSVYKTAAWGFADQPNFYNQALQLQTNFSPQNLMQQLLQIEKEMGRKRSIQMGPRIIDIDILLMNDFTVKTATLTVPHPRLQERRFALTPLNEIASDIIHPILKKTIYQLLIECKDTLAVHKI